MTDREIQTMTDNIETLAFEMWAARKTVAPSVAWGATDHMPDVYQASTRALLHEALNISGLTLVRKNKRRMRISIGGA